MSTQKFDPVLREAMWIAHSKKCAFTHELVDLASMHIDHIIPESLGNKPEDFEVVRQTLGLGSDFDLSGLENLLPAKPGANLQKGYLTFNPASAHFFLNIAASKKAQIERNIEQINRRLNTGRAFILIQQMLKRGQIKPDDVAVLLASSPDEVFRLAERMEFADESEVVAISKADLPELRTRPIRLGANDHLEGLTLGNDAGVERLVKTCVEYEEALRVGFYARNNAEAKLSVFFEHQCGLLAALARATLPTTSYVSEPRLGLPNLELLPFSMFPDPSASVADPPANAGVSYEDKVGTGELIVRKATNTRLVIEEPEGMGQQLVEVVRADFDGDGIEEILVFEYCYATHGTLGFGGLTLLCRRSATSMFEPSPLRGM